MNQLQRILSYVRRAVDDYRMIEPGDKIAVGVSAGKDSLTLLYALSELRRFYPVPYELVAITVNPGFPEGMELEPVDALCRQLNVPYIVSPTDIYSVVFDIRKETNPCSLCAKMRRGALHDAAKKAGCNKVALGHHFDDVVDTFMMSLFYEGRIGCFSPVSYLSRRDLHMIRPLIYTPEKEIVYFKNRYNLPVVKSPCPADGFTERATIHNLLNRLEADNPGLRSRIFSAMQHGEVDGFRFFGKARFHPAEPEDDAGQE